MGRTVIADESVIENLDSMIKKISSDSKLGNPKLYIGVMIGQVLTIIQLDLYLYYSTRILLDS